MTPLASDAAAAGAARPQIRVVVRDADGTLHLDWPLSRIGEPLSQAGAVVWLDIHDPGSQFEEVDRLFREVFHFHPLAIEDALQDVQNPKLDDWNDYLCLVFHSVEFVADTGDVRGRELDIFLGMNYLVTYHNEAMPILGRTLKLIERDGGSRLSMGADHLLYVILDFGVSDYLPLIESLDDALDTLQDEILSDPDPGLVVQIMRIKRAATRMHRLLIPEREIANRLARDEFKQIDARDRVYFRDVYDHLVRMHDISETLRDLISSALDTHLSAVSNRTNNVMKTLTIVSLLFLPLNFAVGFFGMNFFGQNIEIGEIGLPHTVLFGVILLGMIVAPWAMWVYTRRKGWF